MPWVLMLLLIVSPDHQRLRVLKVFFRNMRDLAPEGQNKCGTLCYGKRDLGLQIFKLTNNKLGQYHACWWPGSLRRQDIKGHNFAM